jgi:hypothetical protein
MYGRYETRLRRIIDRATAELRRLQAERAEAQTDFLQNEPGGDQLPSLPVSCKAS